MVFKVIESWYNLPSHLALLKEELRFSSPKHKYFTAVSFFFDAHSQ